MQLTKTRSFLKWPGGKYRLVDRILTLLPTGKELIEPFLGGGSVFLNTTFQHYVLNDANADLISLYQILQKEGKPFIDYCRRYFTSKYNTEVQYYRLREKFNRSTETTLRSALFLYLNRHGFNGLCRYNAARGEFNVPFGRYVKPYFPEAEMKLFHEKAKRAIFVCEDFTQTLLRAKKGSVVYCDPPYVPWNKSANFTEYRSGGFSLAEQEKLGLLAQKLSQRGIPVLLSNHSNAFTQAMYQGAKIHEFSVQRYISCKARNRGKVLELLALYAAFPVQ